MSVANIALVKEIRSRVHDMKEVLASPAQSLDRSVLDTLWAENCAVGMVFSSWMPEDGEVVVVEVELGQRWERVHVDWIESRSCAHSATVTLPVL